MLLLLGHWQHMASRALVSVEQICSVWFWLGLASGTDLSLAVCVAQMLHAAFCFPSRVKGLGLLAQDCVGGCAFGLSRRVNPTTVCGQLMG